MYFGHLNYNLNLLVVWMSVYGIVFFRHLLWSQWFQAKSGPMNWRTGSWIRRITFQSQLFTCHLHQFYFFGAIIHLFVSFAMMLSGATMLKFIIRPFGKKWKKLVKNAVLPSFDFLTGKATLSGLSIFCVESTTRAQEIHSLKEAAAKNAPFSTTLYHSLNR